MDEAELQAMVVQLGGDAKGMNSMLKEAESNIDKTAKHVEQAGSKIEAIKSKLEGIAGAITGAFAAMGTGGFLHDAFEGFAEAESIELRLTAALQANGREVELLTEDYKEFADVMQATTTAEGDAVLAMLAQAEAMGVTGESAKQAVKNAQALAAAQGGSAEAYIRMTAALEQGNVGRLKMLLGMSELADDTDAVAIAQDKLNKMWPIAEAEAESTSGKLKQLANDYGDLKEDMGAILAEAVQPLAEMAKDVVGWFRSLSKETKTAIVVILAMGVAVGTLTAAITVAGIVFNTFFGGIGILFGAAAAGAVGLVAAFGSIGDTFQYIKEQAEAAWEWLKPVREALGFLWDSIVEVGTQTWEIVKQAAVDTWEYIFGETKINWDQIRDYIVDSIITVEYMVRNIGKTWELIWTGIKYYTIKTLNFILNNLWLILAGPVILPIYLAMQVNWKQVWDSITEYASKAFKALFSDLANVASHIADLISGKVSIGDLIKGWTGEIGFTMTGMTIEALDNLEKELEKQYKEQKGQFDEGLEEFKKKRKEAMGITPEEEKKARDTGKKIGKQITKGAATEIKALDAVIYGSIEGIDQYLDYLKRLEGDSKGSGSGVGSTGGGASSVANALGQVGKGGTQKVEVKQDERTLQIQRDSLQFDEEMSNSMKRLSLYGLDYLDKIWKTLERCCCKCKEGEVEKATQATIEALERYNRSNPANRLGGSGPLASGPHSTSKMKNLEVLERMNPLNGGLAGGADSKGIEVLKDIRGILQDQNKNQPIVRLNKGVL